MTDLKDKAKERIDDGAAKAKTAPDKGCGQSQGFGSRGGEKGRRRRTLIGLAGAKLRDLLDQALPGFGDHYQKMEREHSAYTNPTTARDFESAHRM